MSGNAVQRGDLAIFHKRARAQAAVRCGADLVVELPCPYVLSSAEPFARGAVAILAATGLPDLHLAFGCETADMEKLTAVAQSLNTPETQALISAEMEKGVPYGLACQRGLDQALGEGIGTILKTPNNLLAIEYLRAIARLDAPMTPLPTLRRGVDHHSRTPAGGYASATHLRSLIRDPAEDTAQVWRYMPESAAEIFREELRQGRGPAGLDQLDAVVLTLLRRSAPAPGEGYLDDSEGLSQRIRNMASRATSVAELIELVKTKRYHRSRIRRLLFNMSLGMTSAHRPEIPPYIKILAANDTGRGLLRQMAETATAPVISRPGQIRQLGIRENQIAEIESAVTDLQALCFQGTDQQRGGSEWRETPWFLEA